MTFKCRDSRVLGLESQLDLLQRRLKLVDLSAVAERGCRAQCTAIIRLAGNLTRVAHDSLEGGR